ncbi:Hsp33 family molecular chaperone HslO [Marinilactibacillus psychrotolerans]|uniref:33 kDa chaperonin n=1 Tax=Marinilactibacillus psychrotolerans TaxID=191770 RepID=A0AAV3WPX9_9LACT|nr:Hsp33 family molecular chaperone HslO [Marinilactibacillus psychrotolerans]GEL66014.1 33 kDa chaperonin [Marinilactibacillus psychrotolerans]GEQ34710.1 heat-shock protein Hsp33 [Marinilactibacillus psychrotolerans]SDC15423.1 molecular chaperone Hsp33 [Marinilactibacillus psychrotolerans]
MTDKIIKALAYQNEIRVYVVEATEMVNEAQKKHDSWSTATAALGRAMIGTTLLGATLKGREKITVRIEGNGPIGYLVIDSNGKGETKGYIHNPQVNLPLNSHGKLDVRGAVGTDGMLTVSKDLGMKKPFVGQVPLVSGELGEDFTYYMANSEQVPSAIGVSVLVNPDETVKAAGGFMIQVLPNAKEETIKKLEIVIAELPLVSRLMENGETPDEILERLVGKDNYQLLETTPVQFKCDCSKERFGDAIISLGVDEIQNMIDEDHGAEAVCHFCRTKYQYTENDLEKLKEEAASQ